MVLGSFSLIVANPSIMRVQVEMPVPVMVMLMGVNCESFA
jgi:hypothetical protein